MRVHPAVAAAATLHYAVSLCRAFIGDNSRAIAPLVRAHACVCARGRRAAGERAPTARLPSQQPTRSFPKLIKFENAIFIALTFA